MTTPKLQEEHDAIRMKAIIDHEIKIAVQKTKEEILNGFVKEFCNDHNGEIRWLRSVAIDEEDLLKSILSYLSVDPTTK